MVSSKPRRWLLISLLLGGGVVWGTAAGQWDSPRSGSDRLSDGQARPSREVTLKAPVDGELARVRLSEGQAATKGALLVQMDDALQALAVTSADAEAAVAGDEVELAKSQLEQARHELQQIRDAFDRQAAGDFEVRQAKLQVDQAAIQVALREKRRDLAQTQVTLERERLNRFKLLAPFEGRVVEIHAEEGAVISRGEQILDLVSLDPLKAELQLPAEMYGRLEIGRTYQLRAATPVDQVLEATLTSIDPRIDRASRLFRCVFMIDNPGSEMPAGFGVWLVDPDRPQP